MGDRHYIEVQVIDPAPQGFRRIDIGEDHSTFLIGKERVTTLRDCPDPVVVVLQPVLNQGQIGLLIGERAVEPSIGVWTLPAGHIERGEDALIAGARELTEETGIVASVGEMSFLAQRPGTARDKLMLYVQRNRILTSDEFYALKGTQELSRFEVQHTLSPDMHFKNCQEITQTWLAHHAGRRAIDPRAGALFL